VQGNKVEQKHVVPRNYSVDNTNQEKAYNLHLQGLYHTTFTPLGPPQAVQSHTRGLPVQAALRGLAAQAAATEALTKAGSRAMWTGEGHTSSKCGVVIMEVLEVYNRG